MSGNMTICDLIREFREVRGLKQLIVANKVGYSIRQLQRFESEPTSLSKEALQKLSEFYHHCNFHHDTTFITTTISSLPHIHHPTFFVTLMNVN